MSLLFGPAHADSPVHDQTAPSRALAKSASRIEMTDRIIVKYRGDLLPLPRTPQIASASPRAPGLAAVKKIQLSRRFSAATFILGQEKATAFGARVLPLGRMAHRDEVAHLGRQLMQDDPDIEYAVPDRFIYLAQNQAIPNDPKFAEQWPLNDQKVGVQAPAAWLRFRESASTKSDSPDFPLVAIIDTGYRPHVDLNRPDLGRDYVDGGNNPLDRGDARTDYQCPNIPYAQASSWHGLSVEGIIAARVGNGQGTAGLAGSGAGVLHQRVFGPCGGYLSAYIEAIHDAVDYRNARGQRVRVINLSQSGQSPCDAPLQAEVSRAIAAGVAVVASAGNDSSPASSSSPANCQGVISVAATDRFGDLAPYSNRGNGVTLSAPGGDSASRSLTDGVLTTSLNVPSSEPTGQEASDYNFVQGTSFSAPHVAAAAALLFNLNPALTPDKVKRLLTVTAKPLPNTEGSGAGLLDVNSAIERLELESKRVAVCNRWSFPGQMCPGNSTALQASQQK